MDQGHPLPTPPGGNVSCHICHDRGTVDDIDIFSVTECYCSCAKGQELRQQDEKKLFDDAVKFVETPPAPPLNVWERLKKPEVG